MQEFAAAKFHGMTKPDFKAAKKQLQLIILNLMDNAVGGERAMIASAASRLGY
jgi:hypothetical protein